ncbi:MAG: Asp-tRNA(Asn)/Glu-tRNA(Gln) amidotransferase subunit GatA [Candidatus Paceibacterota bacterium]
MNIQDLTIKKFHNGLIKKEFSATEAVEEFFDYISGKDKDINAFIRLSKDLALSQASAVDTDLASGKELDILAGAPLAIKDNILIEGEPTTAASKILQNYRASYDATVIKKLKSRNAIFLGKANMDEFAQGASGENSAFGPTKNPHDLERVPGGTSSGSVAAVASDMAVAGLGSDTGGSIRQPASFCGVVGLKPTYGAVSRYGLIAMASSLDQIGPIAKTVEDAEILFEAIKGKDVLDSTSVNLKTENLKTKSLKEITIGLPDEYFIEGLDKEVASAVEEAIKTLKGLGIKFKKISLPHTKYAISAYYIIMPAEVSANLARYDGVRYGRITKRESQSVNLRDIYLKTRGEGFGEEVKRRIILGTFVLSSGYYDAYYAKAQKVRRLIKNDFDKAFDPSAGGVDVILTPTAPTPAFKIGEKINDPLSMYLSDIFTAPVNLAGLPAISIPTLTNTDYTRTNTDSPHKSASLPVGFQLIGKYFHEADILEIGKQYEAH